MPRRLDDPPQILLWEADSVAIVSAAIFLGMMAGALLPSLAAAGLLGYGLARLKGAGGAGLLVRWLYWISPSAWWCPARAPSHVREWVG